MCVAKCAEAGSEDATLKTPELLTPGLENLWEKQISKSMAYLKICMTDS